MPDVIAHPTANALALYGRGKLSAAQAATVAIAVLQSIETLEDACALIDFSGRPPRYDVGSGEHIVGAAGRAKAKQARYRASRLADHPAAVVRPRSCAGG